MKTADINKVKRALEHVSKAVAALDSIGWLDLTSREAHDQRYSVGKLTDMEDYLRMWLNELTREE